MESTAAERLNLGVLGCGIWIWDAHALFKNFTVGLTSPSHPCSAESAEANYASSCNSWPSHSLNSARGNSRDQGDKWSLLLWRRRAMQAQGNYELLLDHYWLTRRKHVDVMIMWQEICRSRFIIKRTLRLGGGGCSSYWTWIPYDGDPNS